MKKILLTIVFTVVSLMAWAQHWEFSQCITKIPSSNQPDTLAGQFNIVATPGYVLIWDEVEGIDEGLSFEVGRYTETPLAKSWVGEDYILLFYDDIKWGCDKLILLRKSRPAKIYLK